jgi:hypothetical protein
MIWAGHVALVEKTGNAYRLLVGNPERKSSVRRPSRRLEDVIRMDLEEIGWEDVD